MSPVDDDEGNDCPCCVEDEEEDAPVSRIEVLGIDQAQYARQAAKELVAQSKEQQRRGAFSEERTRLDGEFHVLVRQDGRFLTAETITPLPHGMPALQAKAERMDQLKAQLHRRYADALQVNQVVVDRMQAVHWASRARFPIADTIIVSP